NREHYREARRRHLLWAIREKPESILGASSAIWISPTTDPEGYAAARHLWLAQLEKYPTSMTVHLHADRFFTRHDEALAAVLDRHLSTLEPQSFTDAFERGRSLLYQLRSGRGQREDDFNGTRCMFLLARNLADAHVDRVRAT